jgi:hypothetical protein
VGKEVEKRLMTFKITILSTTLVGDMAGFGEWRFAPLVDALSLEKFTVDWLPAEGFPEDLRNLLILS